MVEALLVLLEEIQHEGLLVQLVKGLLILLVGVLIELLVEALLVLLEMMMMNYPQLQLEENKISLVLGSAKFIN